ncbi:gamma-aminobutyric acid type B receptor subunit 1-like isoform X2 [Gigantopelta aegis]|uniref:gamma-aminobutyric acid type B receptor subunit 1-like isoform X2 n=1 Tax=Gigantopelta aegis TaxID=1735272 RepID=UPI001B88CF11|nr:gamma-aminobutyric acid type B receptor subunit 1-like isoform X2 [Gigantopelta aegis]
MFILHYLVFLHFLHGQTFAALKDLYILGLFPMEGEWNVGLGTQPAAELALEYVNNDVAVLPGYRLNMIWNNTKCNAGLGINTLGHMTCNGPTFIMLLGAGCSSVSEVVAEAANLWNLVQVSYGSSSPALTNKVRYPTFFRLVVSLNEDNYARVALLQHFNWTRVTTIHELKHMFSMMMEDIQGILIKKRIEITHMYQFSESPRVSVQQLKEHDARIIIGAFIENKARQLFCEAFKIRFSGPKIVWVIPHLEDNWWKVNDTDCTSNEILSAAGNYFSISTFFESFGTKQDDNGFTLQKFMSDYNTKTDYEMRPGHDMAQAAYDSVWVIARALNATMADLKNTGYGLENFTYTNTNMGELIKNNTRKVNFNSLSGHVFFDKYGDVIRMSMIQQLQDAKLVTVALYDKLNIGNELIWNSSRVLWLNGIVPSDSLKTVSGPLVLSQILYGIMCVFAALGMVLALCFLVFNIKFRNKRIIKMSSPNINNVILVGCILAYTFVFVTGMNKRELPAVCQPPNDIDLFIKIGIITGVNVSIMVLWSILSPSYPEQIIMYDWKVYYPIKDIVLVPAIWHCTSVYDEYFNFIVYGFQAIILLLGVFLAFTTRKVTIPALNDSKATGLCIYNVIVLSTLGLPVALLLKDNLNFQYGLICTLMIVGTTVIQMLIFLPKVSALKKYLKGDDTECRSTINKISTSVKVDQDL